MASTWMAALVAATALATSTGASAEWREARGRHFVVYAEGGEAAVREQAARLEQLDGLMRMLSRTPKEYDEGANPVTVYVVGSVAAVRRLHGGKGDVAGFYQPRATGSVAFTPASTDQGDFSPQLVLFHEYGHHFLLGNYAAPYPGWFSEGYAEYISTTRFTADQVSFGRAAQHRVMGLYGPAIPAERLFDGAWKVQSTQMDAFYGRGWLLTHMIMNDRERARQFTDYMKRVSAGTSSKEAATAAFGDLKVFNRAINAYLGRNRFAMKEMPRSALPIAPIAVRTLGPGEAAMIPYRMRSDRGVDAAQAKALLGPAAKVAARYPADAAAQGWFAEIAYDAGDDAASEAAADRALAADPRSVQALLYKARVHLRRAAVAKADAPAWKEARSWIIRANRVDTNNAAALSLYHVSFLMAGQEPTDAAKRGLQRAIQLVPQDPSLRWAAARQEIVDGHADEARVLLRPLAYDPHAPADNPAARLVALLDRGVTGPAALAEIDRPPATAAAN